MVSLVVLEAEKCHLNAPRGEMQGHLSCQRDETAQARHGKVVDRLSALAGVPGHDPVVDAGRSDGCQDDEADDLDVEWAGNGAENGDATEGSLREADCGGGGNFVAVMGAAGAHGDDACEGEGAEGNEGVSEGEGGSEGVGWTTVHGLMVVLLVGGKAAPAKGMVCETEEEEGHHLSCGFRWITG